MAPQPSVLESVYQAMMLGLRDYVNKNRFPGILLGLSGGIDSAISRRRGRRCAGRRPGARRAPAFALYQRRQHRGRRRNGRTCSACSIDTDHDRAGDEGVRDHAAPTLFNAGRNSDVTEENIQAPHPRRGADGALQQAGQMVLTTGNKSEMSVGYATLYGDMCGGYSVLKDIYKTTVYRAVATGGTRHKPARRAGAEGPRRCPSASITKAPTAELKPNQTDQDHAAALRHARRHPATPDRGGDDVDRRSSRKATSRRRCCACGACSTSPNTSAARRRRA